MSQQHGFSEEQWEEGEYKRDLKVDAQLNDLEAITLELPEGVGEVLEVPEEFAARFHQEFLERHGLTQQEWDEINEQTWCRCETRKHDDIIYVPASESDYGNDTYLHAVCGKVVQLG